MIYHVLNGDALIGRFLETELSREVIVMRECLIEGDLNGDSLTDFLNTRAKFIEGNYQGDYSSLLTELDKIQHASSGSEFNLWFGYDLFCQSNLWFLLALLNDLSIKKEVFMVYPTYLKDERIWEEFGPAEADDLVESFYERVLFTEDDLRLGKDLWLAYKNHDLVRLEDLSKTSSNCFPYLKEVCKAHIARFYPVNYPQQVIQQIIQQTTDHDFPSVFREFSIREGVYGFGDSQLKKLYDEVMTTS